MNDKVDQKIKNILEDLNSAQKKCEKFHARQVVPGKKIQPMDVFEMGRTFATRQKLYIELNIARAEKYPRFFSEEKMSELNKERARLERKIRAYANRQFPSQYRE